jgi:signal transduction histidine kinase
LAHSGIETAIKNPNCRQSLVPDPEVLVQTKNGTDKKQMNEHDLWNIEADAVQINQVFMNLCINAMEAIEGHGRIVITTRNIEADKELGRSLPEMKPERIVFLSVEDTGSGMDRKTKARVFEPSFSTKFQGRGLGPAAVYGIVKNHGGHIAVQSEPAKFQTEALGQVIRKTLDTQN